MFWASISLVFSNKNSLKNLNITVTGSIIFWKADYQCLLYLYDSDINVWNCDRTCLFIIVSRRWNHTRTEIASLNCLLVFLINVKGRRCCGQRNCWLHKYLTYFIQYRMSMMGDRRFLVPKIPKMICHF